MLTNRYHHTRWSLEQNRQVVTDETPPTTRRLLQRRWLWNAMCFLLMGVILFLTFRLTLSLLSRGPFWHGGELESLLDAAEGAILVNEHREQEAHGVLLPVEAPVLAKRPAGQNHAFVTLLCDNSGLANARVLAYGLRRAKTAYPLVVMVLPYVNEGLEDLITLDAIIEKVSTIGLLVDS